MSRLPTACQLEGWDGGTNYQTDEGSGSVHTSWSQEWNSCCGRPCKEVWGTGSHSFGLLVGSRQRRLGSVRTGPDAKAFWGRHFRLESWWDLWCRRHRFWIAHYTQNQLVTQQKLGIGFDERRSIGRVYLCPWGFGLFGILITSKEILTLQINISSFEHNALHGRISVCWTCFHFSTHWIESNIANLHTVCEELLHSVHV